MQNLVRIIRNNKLYVFFLVFLLLVNILLFVEGKYREKDSAEEIPGQGLQQEPPDKPLSDIYDRNAEKETEEKIVNLSKTRPVLYFAIMVLNLTVLFAIFLGMLIDIYFLMRWFNRKQLDLKLSDHEPARWCFSDVIRVTLIFMFFGYIFVILQSFVIKNFPLMQNQNFQMVFNTAFINIVGISVIVYFVTGKYKQNIDTVGLTLKNINRSVLYALVAYIALIPLLLILMLGIFYVVKLVGYKPPVQPIVQVFIEEKQTSVLWLSAGFAAIFGPIAEEIFFRGFMYGALKKKMGIFASMLTTSIIFAFLHGHIVGFLPIMVLGMMLAFLYEKTGSLVSSMVLHMCHNLGMLAMIFVVRTIGT